jgi:hypothetical protein
MQNLSIQDEDDNDKINNIIKLPEVAFPDRNSLLRMSVVYF